MNSVKGKVRNGVIYPDEPINGHEGQSVIVTFVDEPVGRGKDTIQTANEDDWEVLARLADENTVESDIKDLAHNLDHYLYHAPKREES